MCNYHKPVCVACRVDMYPEKNGVNFIELKGERGSQSPYKIWESDQWACPGCGISVLIGFGKKAWAEHYQPEFQKSLAVAMGDSWTVTEREKKDKEKEDIA